MSTVKDVMPQRLAFVLAFCLFVAACMLFLHYRQIQATHVSVTATAISIEMRSTRVNANSARRLYHLVASVPVPGEDKPKTMILKDGLPRIAYKNGEEVSLIYPIGYLEDLRVPTALDSVWPWALALIMSIIAFAAGVLFKRELAQNNTTTKSGV